MAMVNGEDCCVKVAVHIRPLLGDERQQGCKDCVTVVPGKPQVQIGTHSFTFDHVYGGTGFPPSSMFEECVSPLVDGLFQGYNATVLAYGQTGSGKTYTMGTGCKDGSQTGIIPQVMNSLFGKIETLKDQAEFQLRVSFIEILKEEVRDLLDSSYVGKFEAVNGHVGKLAVPGKPPVQIREASNGAITLAGLTEVFVRTQKEMTSCLEQGSLNRATGSTNMNNQSSRSHAIFTITLEQMRKLDPSVTESAQTEDIAGSDCAKRTGSDGLRFKEGVHINKGLLALGNVISALGDEKKRKEGVHVPYCDSKLTRLLQDSLGGNSRTVMIACMSPADINSEETLNTLKYANRARNIQNKPIINRNPISEEIQRMHQHIEYLQVELACYQGGGASDEIQALKEKVSWLEATNEDLCRELCDSKDIDEEVAKEWEHTLLQDSMGKELNELNKRLEQKESEMKMIGGFDTLALKQHFKKKLMGLEEEKKAVQQERDRLLAEVESLAAASDGHKLPDNHLQKLKALEAQILELKKKHDNQVQLLKQKQKSEEAAKKLQEEIQFIEAQKVQLQHKIKQEAEQLRLWKASREKELLQVLQRKSEEAAMATKKLKELLETRKTSAQEHSGNLQGVQSSERSLQRWLDHELVMVHVHEVRNEYEKQSQARTALSEELAFLRREALPNSASPPGGKNGHSSKARRKEMEKQQKMEEEAVATALSISSSVNSNSSLKHSADETSDPLSPVAVPAQKQLKYTAGIVNTRGPAAFDNHAWKMVPIRQLSLAKKQAIISQGGKLWRWRRSHHQWLLQFKWKWQKPWKLSEWIRHSDKTIMRARPRPLPLP
ncbi:kinesin-like protein KIN-4A isoform X4 [Canna indica]|uniref:Kinesin-like protein KIN-4A isoform X4 n=1 Tax=Canna indica TaxID=4628 RepID=A0AAQ3KDX4_9LILI|nr:kinesin-like protein KIN-4A isoform X4 [Canna indica]